MEREARVNEQPLVIKFGGTSVGDGAAFVRAAKIAAGAARERPVAVVVSAMRGTTDTLLGYAAATATVTADTNRTATGATGEGSVAELHRALYERHVQAAREAVSGEHFPKVDGRLRALLKELTEVLVAPAESLEARRATVAVYGERLSAAVLSGAISSAGAPASVVAADPIATDAGYPEAEVEASRTRERCTPSA
jgi:aspartate kinase